MGALNLVVTIIIVVLVLMLLRYLFTDPNTIQSMQDGKTSTTITASSLATNGSSTASSNFSYSVWFYINDWNYRYGEQKVIFGRMGAPSTEGSGSIDGIDLDGDGMIDKVTAHPNRAMVIRNLVPYYARPGFDWNDCKQWINDQNAVNYWMTYKKSKK